MTQVEQIWRDIARQSGQTGLFRRVDAAHPLELYAGIDHHGKRVLLLVAPNAPLDLPPPGIIEVACNQRKDAEWAIIVQLARPDFDEIFGRLCQDLVECTRETISAQGGEVLLRRIGRWRRLLEVGHRKTLSESELRGLIGELWFLQTEALSHLGPEAAVKGWLGPTGAPHDFLFDGMLVEIKTCIPGSNNVTISSLQQLDDVGAQLYLAVVTLAPSTSMTVDAFTSDMLVTRIRRGVEASRTAAMEFDLRLAEAGYVDGEDYTHAWYHLSGVRYFHVTDNFPRLIATGVPSGILNVNYSIDLNSCTPSEGGLPKGQD